MNPTKECVKINTAVCTQDEKDSLQEFLFFVLNRIGDRCDSIVKVGVINIKICCQVLSEIILPVVSLEISYVDNLIK